jgi:hypothetical protein
MLVGYLLEQILGVVLALLVRLTAGRAAHRRLQDISRRSMQSFHDCAIFFAASIQIATIVVLIREDFGISTAGMGDATVVITQAVSAIVLLPTLYNVFIAPPVPGHHHVAGKINEKSQQPTQSEGEAVSTSETRSAPPDSTKNFVLLVLCWLLGFYPFYSKMNYAFGPSKIGHAGVITAAQFGTIEDICTEGIKKVTSTESALMTAFDILTYLPLSFLVLGRIVWLGLQKHHQESAVYITLDRWQTQYFPSRTQSLLRSIGHVAIPLLASGLFWTIFRSQRFQRDMAKATGSGDADSQWTFGQVVSVTVFAPVLVEAWDAFLESRS